MHLGRIELPVLALCVCFAVWAQAAAEGKCPSVQFRLRIENRRSTGLRIRVRRQSLLRRMKRQVIGPHIEYLLKCIHYDNEHRDHPFAETCALLATTNCLVPTYGNEEHVDQSNSLRHQYTRNGWRCAVWSQTPTMSDRVRAAAIAIYGRLPNDNLCDNVDGGDGPWCYVTEDRDGLGPAWDYCHRGCYDTRGDTECVDAWKQCAWSGKRGCKQHRAYGGDRTYTRSGFECESWNSPHHSVGATTAAGFLVGGKVVPSHRNCRNPNGAEGPWCYVKDKAHGPALGWEFCFRSCDVTASTEVCVIEDVCAFHGTSGCRNNKFRVYGGTRARTRNGHLCKLWKSHPSIRVDFGGVMPDHNYCRNPDGRAAPWCYTDIAWDWCFNDCSSANLALGSCFNEFHNCYHSSSDSCKNVRGYGGTKGTTVTGHICNHWWAVPAYRNNASWDHNYCRNSPHSPGTGPWCYTNTATAGWEYCFEMCTPNQITYPSANDIAASNQMKHEPPCMDYTRNCMHNNSRNCLRADTYTGKRATTMNGHTCKLWKLSGETDANLIAGFGKIPQHNLCSNPWGHPRYWCWADGEPRGWNYCFESCSEDTMHHKRTVSAPESLDTNELSGSSLEKQHTVFTEEKVTVFLPRDTSTILNLSPQHGNEVDDGCSGNYTLEIVNEQMRVVQTESVAFDMKQPLWNIKVNTEHIETSPLLGIEEPQIKDASADVYLKSDENKANN